MISVNRKTKFFVCKKVTDMRASFDSLFAKTKELLQKDPFSGHVFVFINKRRTMCKCLLYDGTGMVILSKRLEKGILFSKINSLFQSEISLTQAEFSLFFEGATLNKRFVESPSPVHKAAKLPKNTDEVS